jgi:hypothetical protein
MQKIACIIFWLLIFVVVIQIAWFFKSLCEILSEYKRYRIIDKVLNILKKEYPESRNVVEFCRENVKYKKDKYYNDLTIKEKKKADNDIQWVVSKLIESGRAERSSQNKDSFRITNKGIVLPGGYVRAMIYRIIYKFLQNVTWFAIIAGMAIIIADFLGKYIFKN